MHLSMHWLQEKNAGTFVFIVSVFFNAELKIGRSESAAGGGLYLVEEKVNSDR